MEVCETERERERERDAVIFREKVRQCERGHRFQLLQM